MVFNLAETSVLDDLNMIGRIDKGNMLSYCLEAAKHYENAVRIAEGITVSYPNPNLIIVAGMGGSALGGEFLKDWAQDTLYIPIETLRDYNLPAFVNEKTLAFIVSYSGETEETLNCFSEAVKRKCMVVCICSAGNLLAVAEKLQKPTFQIPRGMPPRAAFPYLFTPMLIFLEKIGLIYNAKTEISEAIEVLRQISSENAPEKPLNENFSKRIAVKINGTVPIIYGFRFYRSVAQRFKQQFNENSKNPSFWNVFPELNHNEIVGWEAAGQLAKCFSAIIIRDIHEPEEIKCQIEKTKEILEGNVRGICEVWGRGAGKLAKMLSTALIGDFASVYLALLRGVDPTPVESISILKRRMADAGLKNRAVRNLQSLCNK